MTEHRRTWLVTLLAIALILCALLATANTGFFFALFVMVMEVDGKSLPAIAAEAAQTGECEP